MADPVSDALGAFGHDVAEKLGRGGEDEEQLRAPFEDLLRTMGRHIGVRAVPYGEVHLKAVRARPDFAVDVAGVRVGYIELKAPGRGVPSTWRRPRKEDKDQWAKLAALPNVLYSDGTTWALYRYGELAAPPVELEGDLFDRRRPLRADSSTFETLITDFLTWEPERPRSLPQLINIVAGLCRLLRDEVAAVLADPSRDVAHEELVLLAADWRDLLFPDLDDFGFADAYAQTVTFALLLARIDGIPFDETPLHEIARLLGKKHSLMGRALAVLTDTEATEELRMIATLSRVIGTVDWNLIDEQTTDVHADLYERFLGTYDPALRRRSGSYYTPQAVAAAVVDFVDEILRTRFDLSWGLAADDVAIVDPAMGTGTFLVEVLRRVAETVQAKQGRGARGPRLRRLFQDRLVGFEVQAAPYAVAELRLHQALKTQFSTELPPSELRFLTDALEDPDRQQGRLRAGYRVIERARQEANRIKREVPVMVVVGNPPHVENTMGRAPWIEARRKIPVQAGSFPQRPSLDEFRTPGGSRYESDLYGLPWCFWRWAIWKSFEAHPNQPQGIVALVTPSSFIRGRSFEGMREYLRRTCDEGWIIELSPEGNRPPQDTRIFGPDVGRQLCIAVFARYGAGNASRPAVVHHAVLTGARIDKLEQLQALYPAGRTWATCRSAWTAPFLKSSGEWDEYPSLKDLFPESSRGVTAGRTWVYAPDKDTLHRRWITFTRAGRDARRRMLPESRDRTVDTVVGPLPGFPRAKTTLAKDVDPPLPPVQVTYRSFDRQWVIPDSRLMVMPRPPLWAVRSPDQIYLTEQSNHAIRSGPGVTFTQLIPDLHHYNGRSGRVFPLYCDAGTDAPNITPGLLDALGAVHGRRPEPAELFAYVAAVVAHRAYTHRFSKQLEQPGIHVPLTADSGLWLDAVAVGYEVLWLQTFGRSTADCMTRRPQFRDFVDDSGPRVMVEISCTPGNLPATIHHEPHSQALIVGNGRIHPVKPAVWDYDVGGMRVVRHWFNYRSATQPHRRRSSDLDEDTIRAWSPDLTDELLAILTVLDRLIELEPKQRDLLGRICRGPLVSTSALTTANVLPVSRRAHRLTAAQPIPGMF